jgi:hypothetical protein
LLPTFALAAALSMACPPDNGIEAICGPVASEDLARIPGTRWLIASGLNIGAPAHLYLIDSRSKRSRALFPSTRQGLGMQREFRDICPGPLQPGRMSLDGLGIRAAGQGRPPMLLAANHGDRHAIEFFRVEMRPEPVLTWAGCVPMPKGTLANAVVPLADGGMLVSSFHDPDDRDAWNRMDRGEPTGGVWEWHADRGWKMLPIGAIPGANGIETSTDERTLYISAWASQQLLVFDRVLGATRAMPLDFRPDNIHRAPDGSLIVGGQRARVRDIAACGASCPQPWLVARIDPSSGAVTNLLAGPGSELTNYACGGMEIDGTLFMTLRGAPRIAWKRIASSRRDP